MKRRGWSLSLLRLLAGLAAQLALNVCAHEGPKFGASSPSTFEGRTIATELTVELKQLIDAARRLHEEPGLILSRAEIETTIGARLIPGKPTRSTEGGRNLSEGFAKEGPLAAPFWEGQMYYSTANSSSDAWAVRVRLDYARATSGDARIVCYSSRLLGAYWARPFVYRPIDVHEQLREWTLPPGASPTGPHDGRPYRAEFRAAHLNTANISFHFGRGSCLSSIRISRLFNFRKYSNEHIYHE